jgi:zinc transport system substrate-binding protein
VERVGGDHVTVGTILPPGQSPHTYEPTPHQVAALTDARAFFLVGMPFETAMARKAGPMAPGLLIADARDASIVMRMMTADEVGADRDDRDTGHEHAGGEPDPHIWLAPRNAEPMAEHARKVLTELDPANASDYEANRARLCEDIDAADARIRAVLAPFRGGAVLVYHPAFGYFTDAYGLRQVPVEVEGKEPSPRQLAALAARARAESARVLFVQPQFAIATAEALAREIGAAVVPLDDLGRDYVANLETIAAKIEEALATPPEGRRANDQPAGS